MRLTTLCYIERGGKYLMLYRNKKKNDANEGKWIGVGGGFSENESPEECLFREVFEETGLTLSSWRFRGIVTFASDRYETEYMHLFTADGFSGEPGECPEGELAWIPIEEIENLPLWEGDRVFLRLLRKNEPFFSLKLSYTGERLSKVTLNGKAPFPD
ncbi:MAG: NUDIX hydrolase [Eubacteriales bacterium]